MILYATDLDGTLLNEQARLSAHTARAFRALQQRGAAISFVTARTPATVEPILRDVSPQYPGVVMTGAGIWDPIRRNYLSVIYHHPDHVRDILDICREASLTPFVYTLPIGTNKMIVYHENADLSDIEKTFVDEREPNDLKVFNLGSPISDEAHLQCVLFFAMGDPALIRATADQVREKTGCYASWYPDTYRPGLALLEIFAPGVSKAAGLKRLKRLVGADKVIAFGDNLNDIPMLQSADMAIAVGNAHPQVKALADEVIGTNNEDAVIRFIRNHHLGVTI